MRKLLVITGLALVSLTVAATALANGRPSGESKEGKKERSHEICRAFELTGVLGAVEARSVVLAVGKGRPRGLRGTEVTLGIGSRTRVHGTLATGAKVVAHGVVCQLDDADASAFFTKKVKVKRAAPATDEKKKGAKTEFELVGVVGDVGDGWLVVHVDRGHPERLAGKDVKVMVLGETDVDGDVEEGAVVLVAGWSLTFGDSEKLVAKLITVKEGASSDEDDDEKDEE